MVAIAKKIAINGDRLNHSIETLAEIGQLPTGGVRRLAFSPEDVQARRLIKEWMLMAGMAVRTDAAGNLIGTLAGREDLPVLSTGSHIDTVPNGGKYDGTLGVLAGIEVARTLQEQDIQLRHPFEVVVFSDEEGGMLGCKGMAGTAERNTEVFRRQDGRGIEECLEAVGGDWAALETAKRDGSEIAAFVELHVEQGGVLESEGIPVGVVEGVVGMFRGVAMVEGEANHAGTTPMNQRHDALVAASKIVLGVNELGHQEPGGQVATVGVMQVSPNAANIVPGQVEMGLGIRDLSQERLDGLVHQLRQLMDQISQETDTTIELFPKLWVEPALAAQVIQGAIAEAATEMGLEFMHLPSRAGHDAMEMARITDMGMIFVPSKDGISHSELEYTSPEECVQGANILLNTLMKLDARYDH